MAKDLEALTAKFNKYRALFNELKVMEEPDKEEREEPKSYRDVAYGFSSPSLSRQVAPLLFILAFNNFAFNKTNSPLQKRSLSNFDVGIPTDDTDTIRSWLYEKLFSAMYE